MVPSPLVGEGKHSSPRDRSEMGEGSLGLYYRSACARTRSSFRRRARENCFQAREVHSVLQKIVGREIDGLDESPRDLGAR